MSTTAGQIFERLAPALNKTPAQLEEMGRSIFASMLLKALDQPGRVIWTRAHYQGEHLDLEVDVPPRQRTDSNWRSR